MNYKLNINTGGLIFSKFSLAIHSCLNLDDVDNLYFNIVDRRVSGDDQFKYVFDQTLDASYKDINCRYVGMYGPSVRGNVNKQGVHLGTLEGSPDLIKYKSMVSNIKIKPNILKEVEKYKQLFNINDKTLAVHLRTTGYNIAHGGFGVHYTKDYLDTIDEVLQNEDIDNIFLASENRESIKIMKDRYGTRVNYIDGLIRSDKESELEWFMSQGFHNVLNNEKMWIEAFVDVLLLSLCKIMVCRVCNVSQGVMMFSPHDQKIYRPHDHWKW